MHEAVDTVTAAALVQVESASHLAGKFIQTVPSTEHDLKPLLSELYELQWQLNQTCKHGIPRSLQLPLINVVEGCADICKRVGDILDGCRDDTAPETGWALVGASAEIYQLQSVLYHGRRTIQLLIAALILFVQTHETPSPMQIVMLTVRRDNNFDILVEIDELQEETVSGTSTLRKFIVDCLDALKEYVSRTNTGTKTGMVGSENAFPSPTSPAKRFSVHDMMLAFRRHSTLSMETQDSAVCATDDPDDHVDSDTTCQSSQPVPRKNLDVEVRRLRGGPGRRTFEQHGLRPPPIKVGPGKSQPGSPTAHKYSLFPPSSPPPSKALPPIPFKSVKESRPVASSASDPRAVATSRQPVADPPATNRERAYSDFSFHSNFSAPLPAPDRFFEAPRGTIRPPRSTSYSFSSSHSYQASLLSPRPETIHSQKSTTDLEIIPLRRLEGEDGEGSHGGVYAIETLPQATILASRHGKFHIKIWDLASGTSASTIKVPFYVQVQARSREYFIRSHSILSETQTLIGITTGFGQTLEIWNWSKRRKLQTINNAMRWTAVRSDVHESRCPPLATYNDKDNNIELYSVSLAKKPFMKVRKIEFKKAGLPHLPKLPELAFSATGPLLVAAAGPRPPRPGNPPPSHSALLMAWQLDGGPWVHEPYKFLHAVDHPELRNSLPLSVATYGSVAVSIWEAAKFRTFGKEGMWQVESVTIAERVVLVWDFSGAVDRTSTYRIPAVLACASPDCRFVAYCDPGGRFGVDSPGALVVVDATRGGQELWRLDEPKKDPSIISEAEGSMSGASVWSPSRWSRKSSSEGKKSDRRSSLQGSDGGSFKLVLGAGGLDTLAANLKKVTELSFSGDGTRLFVGDSDGGVGIYEFRVDGLQMTNSRE